MTEVAELSDQLRRMVVTRAKDVPHLWDDLHQEAMIAAWQQLDQYPGSPDSHAVRSAQFRVSKVVGGKPFTGEPRHPGRKDAHDTSIPLTPLSRDGEEFLLVEPEEPSTEAQTHASEVRAAILAAVSGLEPLDRASVHLRFWEDRDWAGVSEAVGRPRGTLMRRWTEIVRPALADALQETYQAC